MGRLAAGLLRPLGQQLEAHSSAAAALRIMQRHDADALPVLQARRPPAALTRELLERASRHGVEGLRVSELLVGQVPLLGQRATLAQVASALQQREDHPLVLVGRHPAGLHGFITRGDLERLGSRGAVTGALPPSPAIGPLRLRALHALLPAAARAALRTIAATVSQAGGQAFLVGGTVRDLLLGRAAQDLDVLVLGELASLGPLLAQRTAAQLRRHGPFLTAELRLPDGLRIDVAQARVEHYRQPAALPEVQPGSLRQDLMRRDFTINALALQLSATGFARLFDAYGGVDDLRHGRLRALHGLSFIEDPTRALRAAALAARLGFAVEPRTRRLMQIAAQQGVLERLSASRLRRELERLLGGPAASRALRLLDSCDLLAAVHPALRPTPAGWKLLAQAERSVAWHRRRLAEQPVLAWAVLLSALLLERAAADVSAVLGRLQPSAKVRELVREAAPAVRELLAALGHAQEPSDIYRACRNRPTEHLLLALAAAPAAGPIRRALSAYLVKMQALRADITGRDLLRAGLQPGPQVARALEAALLAKLAGTAPTREAQLRAALRRCGIPR